MTLRYLFLIICLTINYNFISAQEITPNKPFYFGGGTTITNNGISLLPNFTLGKPAAIFDMSAGNDRLKFEPQLRFSLEGKPWTFVFWWRYKILKDKKIKLSVGAHPALVFREEKFIVNGIEKEYLTSRRFLASEVFPNYAFTKNINLGIYYLYSHGIENDVTQNTHFIALNSTISNIKIYKKIQLKFQPQVFYLKMDNKDGFYSSATFNLERKGFPLVINSIVNKKIESTIAGKDFIWNIGLVYSFSKKYTKT
ncbi:hypothetical protein OX283_003560 [Flavobacterium sp. SUN052]|uniref:hypothetical protein n=1 Tax=Flavobacterium sp. SUN052 TaxID=3002441 RepID=UPI00237D60E9|nr:hypothetical protein [Flavobacterium sp. SUN052]MEC4003720.1 hypothetical protein [Flavobacterium sp. SUN052]